MKWLQETFPESVNTARIALATPQGLCLGETHSVCGFDFFFPSALRLIVQNCRILLPESSWKGLVPVWVFPTWRCGWAQPDGLGELQKPSLDVELFPDFFLV